MGQRHQAWLIARVVPHGSTDGKPYYRSLGGWHNQWCYGLLPVEALDRFITLIKNPVNAALIREELKAIEGKLGKTRPTVHLPCPYTHFLLASAFNTDLDNKFTHMASFTNSSLSSTMNCWGVQNDDGITIIDITDPFNPSYAFCISPGSISTAREYVYGNYRETIDDSGSEGEDDEERRPNSHSKGNSRKLFAKFDRLPVLGIDAFVEAWNYRKPKVQDSVMNEAEPESEASATTTETSSDSSAVPSLTGLVLEPAIARSLESGVTDAVEHIIQENHPEIKAVLKLQNPFPDNGLPLLLSVLQTEFKQKKKSSALDLSGFSLSPEQLVSIVSDVQLHLGPPRSIILNDSPHITAEHIRTLLTARPTLDLDRLEICNTSITNETLASLINTHPTLFHRTSDVIHPFFTSGKVPITNGCFHVFTMKQWDNLVYDQSNPRHPAVPTWTPKKIVQTLLDWLDVVGVKDWLKSKGVLASIAVRAAMGGGLRSGEFNDKVAGEEEEGSAAALTPKALATPPWKERTVTSYLMTTEIGVKGKEQVRDGDWVFLFEQWNELATASKRLGLGEPYPGNRYAFVKVFRDELQEEREEVKKENPVNGDEEAKDGSSERKSKAEDDSSENKGPDKSTDNKAEEPAPPPPSFTVKTYDLAHFLKEMENEGRGPLPDQNLIDHWNNRLIEGDARLKEEMVDSYHSDDMSRSDWEMLETTSGPIPVTLFDEESAVAFMQKAHWSPWAGMRF